MNERYRLEEARQTYRLRKIVGAELYLALIALIALCTCATAQDNTSNYWFENGTELLWAGSYEESLQAFDRAVQLDSKNYEAWMMKGRILTYLGRYDESLQAYDMASNIDRSKPETQVPPLMAKAYTLMAMDRYDEAEKVYESIVKLNISTSENAKPIDTGFILSNGWRGEGNALTKLGRYDEAIQAYDKAIELNSENAPYAWTGKGNALRDMKRYDDAIDAYDNALGLYPESANAGIAETWKGKGDVFSIIGKRDEAFAAYEKAIQAYDEEINTFNKASALDKAVSITFNPYPVNAEFWNNRGNTLKALGHQAEAEESFTKATELGH